MCKIICFSRIVIMDYDQNSKVRMEKVINDLLRLASDEIKKSFIIV